tara:strand:- start:2904 stop:3344 length:441 start_codon:yes stop_codon:yes gene_type:complete
MRTIDRLVRISCYYNKVKFADFHNVYTNPRTKDARAMVYHILHHYENYGVSEIAEAFNKELPFVKNLIEYHYTEYDVIHHYTKMYHNIFTQFTNWNNSSLDLAYSIIKTKYDYDYDIKYESLLNENNKLNEKINILKRKNKKLCIN